MIDWLKNLSFMQIIYKKISRLPYDKKHIQAWLKLFRIISDK